jgi:tetratricopeptide (TPR) repeat protein
VIVVNFLRWGRLVKIAIRLLLCISALLCVSWADHEGHHHEDLNESQLGTVHFPVSCADAQQKPFQRGVALLHSFWYEEAQKEFEQIAKDDPTCAMAHWGIAMSLWHQLWNRPDEKVLAQGLGEVNQASKGKLSARERGYVNAARAFYADSGKHDHEARARAYSDAMRKVHQDFPDDHEAAAFYALSLLASEPDEDATFANRKEAAAVLEKLFAIEPDHPGVAHYLIHSYDKPQLAQLGLPAARRYAQVAPAAPHALHMPSHIFARVGLWDDDIKSNLASVAATRKTAAMHMGGEGHQFHAMNFLVYAYLQNGREADAAKVIEEVKTMHHMDSMYGSDFDPQTNALSEFPALYDLELRRWADAASLQPVQGALPGDLSITYWARAIGAARSGKLDQAHKDLDSLDSNQKELLAHHRKSLADAVGRDRAEAAAWVAHAENKNDEAIKTLRELADREEKLGDEPRGIPAREMLADMLLEMNQPQQALNEYQADLKFSPNRFNGLAGAARAAEASGDKSLAATFYGQLAATCAGSSSQRPELAKARESAQKPAEGGSH